MRDLVRAEGHDRRRSLGWLALAWMEALTRHGPGDMQGRPVVHGDEVSGFVADCYALESIGRLLYDSAFLSRPKGTDKSGLAARLSLFEGLGPCRFAGWAEGGEVYEDPWGLGFRYVYSPDEPMGAPVTVPYIRIMATEEGQTGNVYKSIHFNLTDDECPLAHVPGVESGLKNTTLPGGGEITPSTAGSASKDGGKETFSAFDETHLYVRPELRDMYATVTRNLRKRKATAGTWYLEATTMFAVGEQSVAEETYKLAEQIQEGRVKRDRLLFDHRYGVCEDLADEDALREALIEAYGEAISWQDLEGLIDGFYDPRNNPADSSRYFLNTPGGSGDSWLLDHEWIPRCDASKVVADGEMITLGFDGSRSRVRGVTDATALIACRVSDGHLFEPLPTSVWEQPAGAAGRNWTVPVTEVDAAVHEVFRRYQVVGFFADPAKWETWVAAWTARYARQLQVKASQHHPIEWWMTGGRLTVQVRALLGFHDAVVDGELTHDGSYAMTRHVLAARRRPTRSGILIAKEHPESARKIDAAVAAVLAWEARVDAVAAGVKKKTQPFTPVKLR